MFRLRLKEILEQKGMTQTQLFRITDVSMHTIQTIYHNPQHDVSLSTLIRLARGLQVDVTELFEVLPYDYGKP